MTLPPGSASAGLRNFGSTSLSLSAALRSALLLALFLTAWLPLPSAAHSLGLSLLTLNQTDDHQYQVAWQPAEVLVRRNIIPKLEFPDNCTFEAPVLSCPNGLEGTLRVAGLPQHADVVLRREIKGEAQGQQVMLDGQVQVDRDPVTEGMAAAAGGYLIIGIEHIVLGIDHLLFVFGLVLLTGYSRMLLWTITAFTVSHSLSLTLSALDIIRVPIPPVELVIALSIVLVVREALSSEPTLARRAPWLVALGFGFVHGLGFAGALADIGLPATQELIALAAFNLGVELGQIAVIAVLWLGWRMLRQAPDVWQHPGRIAACYSIGTLATLWSIERGWVMISLL